MHSSSVDEQTLFMTTVHIQQLEDFSWRMRSLLGGDLFAVLAQIPAWPSARLKRPFLNVLVITADLEIPRAERFLQQFVLPNMPGWRFPVDIVGYQDFGDKSDLGDPTVVGICMDSYVAYDSEGAFNRLKEKLQSRDGRVINNHRLQEYLATKRDAHYANAGLLLARLLNEIYMGTTAGLAYNVVAANGIIDVSLLRDLAQWAKLKQRLPRDQGTRYRSVIESIEELLSDIVLLLTGTEDAIGSSGKLNYGQDILALLEQLIGDLKEE